MEGKSALRNKVAVVLGLIAVTGLLFFYFWGKTYDDPPELPDPNIEYGTKFHPAPPGMPLVIGDKWEVTILEITPDAWPAIHKTNKRNPKPEKGYQYVMAEVLIQNIGFETASPGIDLDLHYFGSDNELYQNSNELVIPNNRLQTEELRPGQSVKCNACWTVKSDAVEGLIEAEQAFTLRYLGRYFEAVR